jgi:hypothetical protein
MDSGVWLRGLGLGKYDAVFSENEITEKVLPKLTAEDLKDLGVSIVGHRRTLLDAIAALRSHPEKEAPTLASAPAPSSDATVIRSDHLQERLGRCPQDRCCNERQLHL